MVLTATGFFLEITLKENLWKSLAVGLISLIAGSGISWFSFGANKVDHSAMTAYVEGELIKYKLQNDKSDSILMKLDYLIKDVSEIKSSQKDFDARLTKVEKSHGKSE